ncbi:CAP domain-containing protein [Patescibacteria group bacterium]|nr:MAG: CAP domain-containing protein [Patescibacteria group bacterium]
MIVAGAFGVFLFRDQLIGPRLSPFKDFTGDLIQRIEKRISAPPPLRSGEENPQALLTAAGIVRETNARRADAGLPALAENAQLRAAARAKLADMLAKQYFAHEAPDGTSVSHWADSAGYRYAVIGENLALGNFQNDAALVDAWMASEGHRANILSSSFTEIGAAAGQGMFEGKKVWLTVQEFGKPLAACREPDAQTRSAIETTRSELDTLKNELDRLRAEIKATPRNRSGEYRQKIETYNTLVLSYNSLLDELQRLVAEYNSQVETFNVCLQK